jgi:hypothetical protein
VLFPTHLLAAAIVGRMSPLSTLWLVVGAAVPDVVDKPLGLLGIVDLYHTVGHSVILLAVLTPVALVHRGVRAAAVGWGGHLALDALHVIVNGRPADVLSLAWPVTASPDPLNIPPGSFAVYYAGSPSFVLELVLWGFAGLLVLRDVRPEFWTGSED